MGALNEKGLESLVNELKPSVVRQMTKVEFDALSEEEKKGLIYVTDERTPAIAAGGNASRVYSTEKKIIGTWHDGRPVYQQTYTMIGVAEAGVTFNAISEYAPGTFMIDAEGYFWRYWDAPVNGEMWLFSIPYTQCDSSGKIVISVSIGSSILDKSYEIWFTSIFDYQCPYKAEFTIRFVEPEEGGAS